MRRPGLILLAGTLAGILPCGAATSQTQPSSVLNTQVQLGDVFSSQTLNVETVTDQTVGGAHAAANTYQASTDGSDLDIRSNQTAAGAVAATTELNVGSNSGAYTQVTTTATGNAGESDIKSGVMTGVMTQTSSGPTIAANGHIEAPGGETGDVDVFTQAQGNSHVATVSGGTAGLRINQTNGAQVTSDGGGVYGYVGGTAQFQAATMGNDITYEGDGGSGARIVTRQANNAALTQAAQFTAFGQVQDGTTIASASGNNLDAVNQGFLMDATASQENHSYVRAQAETAAASFGALTATANGIGNSITIGDVGGEAVLDSTQVNDGGGIEAIASVTGGDGYDAYANATAAGNSVVGYACSECSGRISIGNNQTNSADVGATSTLTTTGTVRSVNGVSHAYGNTATYYVSKPSGN